MSNRTRSSKHFRNEAKKVRKNVYLLFSPGLKKAYLDIETSGKGNITVVGVYRSDGEFLQLVKPDITLQKLFHFLEAVDILVTYNGEKFDFKVIKNELGLDVKKYFKSLDLMYLCWSHNLYGGLKKVESKLGIGRDSETAGINGLDAIKLWWEYEVNDDNHALRLLTLYNKMDVENLVTLENKLKIITHRKIMDKHPTLNIFLGP